MSVLSVPASLVSSPFEYDAIASKPGVELWAIRVPHDVNFPHLKTRRVLTASQLKASRLSDLNVTCPSPNEPHSHPAGTLKTKSQTYELVPAGWGLRTHEVVDEAGRQPTARPGLVDAMAMDIDTGEEQLRIEGGEEMSGGMRLLVPRLSEGGKLFVCASQTLLFRLVFMSHQVQYQSSITFSSHLNLLDPFQTSPQTIHIRSHPSFPPPYHPPRLARAR